MQAGNIIEINMQDIFINEHSFVRSNLLYNKCFQIMYDTQLKAK